MKYKQKNDEEMRMHTRGSPGEAAKFLEPAWDQVLQDQLDGPEGQQVGVAPGATKGPDIQPIPIQNSLFSIETFIFWNPASEGK